MDNLSSILDGPRAQRAFVMRTVVDAPWALRIADGSALTLVAMTSGGAVVSVDGATPVAVAPSEICIVTGTTPYRIACDDDVEARALIGPGQVCTTLGGEPLVDLTELGVRTWGDRVDGSTSMLTGSYALENEVTRRLLHNLPAVLVVAADATTAPLVALLRAEIAVDGPGQQAMLDRLLDSLLIATLRSWFAMSGAPGWYRAEQDAVVGRALRLMRDDLAHPWTVASLARATGVSRASFAARFSDLVGESPIAFLRESRLREAAERLRRTRDTIATIADGVGYASGYALSAAFSRANGESPGRYRERSR